MTRALVCADQKPSLTFHGDVDPGGQKQTTETVVEDLVPLQSGSRMVGDLNAWEEMT